jgi:two-component sensor histidine kinase
VGLPPNIEPGTTQSLGLRLVSLLVRQLDGTMDVQSATGRGTSFTLTLCVRGE